MKSLTFLSFLLILAFGCHIFAHAPIAEADLERCRAIEYDSEPCWLELLDFVERAGKDLIITLYNGTETVISNPECDPIDPCLTKSFYDYVPTYGIAMIELHNEGGQCALLMSMITGDLYHHHCIRHYPDNISSNFRYIIEIPAAMHDSRASALCSEKKGAVSVHLITSLHQPWEQLNYYPRMQIVWEGSIEGITDITISEDGAMKIVKYADDDIYCNGEPINTRYVRINPRLK